MYGVELYAAVRLAVVDEGLSHHEAGRRFGIDRRTVKKMLSYSAPPGYRRTKPVRRPKLDGFTGIVDAILEADTDPDVPRKQRHTAHRIFERLRDEHGFTGGYTIVKDYVRSRRQSTREAFVPLHHPPGHAQVDFGEAVVEVGGRREKVAFFCLILPHSNLWFVKAYPRETTEAFLDGHVSAFAFLGGVPRSILYDNTTLAVARILGDRHEPCRLFVLTRAGAELPLQSVDLRIEVLDPIEQKGAQLTDRSRQPRTWILEGRCQPIDMSRSLRRDNAKLRQVAPQRVDRLRALAHQKIARVEQHRPCLLFFRLHRHEAHRRALRRLADRLCIRHVVLMPLHQRGHTLPVFVTE